MMDKDFVQRFSEEYAEWEVYIGKFILAFGEIETATYELLLALPTEDLSKLILKMSFASRVDLIVELLPQRVNAPQLVEELISKLNQTKDLAGTRNIIAHNPITLSFFEQKESSGSKQVISKFHNDFEKVRKTEIDLNGFIEKFTELQLLKSEIVQLQYRVEDELLPGK